MFKSSPNAIRTSLHRFLRDEGGATSIEYAIIASGLSIVIVGTVATLGSNVKSLYTSVATALK
jgi:pilus assembly protein Flp/PilA